MTDVIKEENLAHILRIIPVRFKNLLRQALRTSSGVQEIVLRSNQPVCIYTLKGLMFLTTNGCLTYNSDTQPLIIADAYEVTECFNVACGYSVYSHMNEIKEGYVTISGGHRIGISGTAVIASGEITNIRDISTVSVRVCREVSGCGKDVVSIINDISAGIVICGAPCSGKTTVLRDVARILSSEEKRRVALVDTRGELASSYKGIPQINVGFCDVLSNYPRTQGIMQAIRIFSPEFILCDEIGTKDEYDAVLSGINSGVRFVTTSHSANYKEFVSKPYIKSILSTGAFEKIVFLESRENPGKVSEITEVGKRLDG